MQEHAYVKSDGHRFCKVCCADKRKAKRRANMVRKHLLLPFVERFWLFVDKTPGQGPRGECWSWKMSRNPNNYGQVWHPEQRRPMLAHVIAYLLTKGPLPEGKPNVCHHCDYPPCCRPEHLFAGTQADNMADMLEKGRGRWKKQQAQ